MLNYIWPVALVVFSNTFYHICAKSVPDKINPFASLTVTYLIGAVISLVLYFMLNKGGSFVQELSHLNWAPFILGIVIVGLEAGNIYAYKAGWPISLEQIVQGSCLAVLLIVVGYFIYKEPVTWNKIAGIIVCLAGLGLINMK